MGTGAKIAIGGGIVGTIVLIWVFSKKKVADNLDVSLENAGGLSVDLTGVHGTLTVALHNPKNAQLRVKYPYIRILINGKFIGNSDIKDTIINIQANAVTKVDIDLNLQSLSTLAAMPPIVQDIAAGKSVIMEIQIITGLEFTDLPPIIEKIPLKK